jgi:putative tricarboxylic transport membrane protein
MNIMIPLIIVLSVTGVYAINSSMFDVIVLVVLGIIGYLLMKFGISAPPVVLGIVLGPIIEPNLIRSLISSDMNPVIFLTRPISLSIIILTIILLILMLRQLKTLMGQ